MIFCAAFWQKIIQWDRSFFHTLNSDWTNPVFDKIMPFIRDGKFWVPLYLFLFVFVMVNFRKYSGWWILMFICTVAITDMTGNYGFKHVFGRIRPCNDPTLDIPARLLLKHCGAGKSFISNHAANHFAMATFIFMTLRPAIGRWAWLAIGWAALIAYAQVYVGVHYPLDVICGALVGALIGMCTALLFNKRYHFANFDAQPES